jgi:mercuric ion transport protein
MSAEKSHAGKWSVVGAVLSALAASICCIGPLALLASGVGGAWASGLQFLEPYRPIFVAATLGFVGFAFYRAYRTSAGGACADGSCTVPRAVRASRIALWIVTPIILALLAFPYVAPYLFAGATTQGTCCPFSAHPAAASAEDTDMRKNAKPNLISVFEIPLVCGAAPQIGCGLRAKPILLELQRDPNIAGAWLNSAGTVLAVVGTDGSSREARAKAVQAAALAKDGVTATELDGDARERQLKSFRSDDAWYRGAEVDALSKQEAGIIAARLVRRVRTKATLPDEKAKALESAIAQASYRFVSGQADVPRGDFMDKYDNELMKLAAQAKLDDAEIAALKDAVAKGFHPLQDER